MLPSHSNTCDNTRVDNTRVDNTRVKEYRVHSATWTALAGAETRLEAFYSPNIVPWHRSARALRCGSRQYLH